MNWVHLSTRLLVASIFVLVGEAGPRVVNPLIGGLLHYNELASSRRHSGFIGLALSNVVFERRLWIQAYPKAVFISPVEWLCGLRSSSVFSGVTSYKVASRST